MLRSVSAMKCESCTDNLEVQGYFSALVNFWYLIIGHWIRSFFESNGTDGPGGPFDMLRDRDGLKASRTALR